MPVKRRPVTIQLHPRNDADIIDKIRDLPEGERNTELKSVLRAGFALPHRPSTLPEGTGDTSELRSEITELRERMAWMQEMLEQLPDYLTRMMEQLVASKHELPTQPAQPVDIEEAPRLSDDEMANRTAKLKKSGW